MKFICKACGEEKEINIFSREIFGCWCDHCGRKIPRQRNFLLIKGAYYCSIPLLIHFVEDWASDMSFVEIKTFVATSVAFYGIWVLGMFLEGRKLPKDRQCWKKN